MDLCAVSGGALLVVVWSLLTYPLVSSHHPTEICRCFYFLLFFQTLSVFVYVHVLFLKQIGFLLN